MKYVSKALLKGVSATTKKGDRETNKNYWNVIKTHCKQHPASKKKLAALEVQRVAISKERLALAGDKPDKKDEDTGTEFSRIPVVEESESEDEMIAAAEKALETERQMLIDAKNKEKTGGTALRRAQNF